MLRGLILRCAGVLWIICVGASTSSGFELRHTLVPGSDQVWMRWGIRGGASQDVPGLEGLSHFCVRGLFTGTETRTQAEIQELLDVLGAKVEVSSSADGNAIDLVVAADLFESFLYLLRDLLTQPAFEPQQVEALRKILIGELNLGVGPAPVIGTRAGLERITSPDLRTFHQSHYLSRNMEAQVSSPWDEATTRRLLEQNLDTLP